VFAESDEWLHRRGYEESPYMEMTCVCIMLITKCGHSHFIQNNLDSSTLEQGCTAVHLLWMRHTFCVNIFCIQK